MAKRKERWLKVKDGTILVEDIGEPIEPPKVSFGRRMRKVRRDFGITLKELSFRTEISLAHLSDLENDKHSPSLRYVRILADVFNMNLSEFMEGVR